MQPMKSKRLMPAQWPSVATVDMKFELVVIPVSDVDRAKQFYAKLGWRLDADFDNGNDFRVVQFTPPGSGCSIIFGKNVTGEPPPRLRSGSLPVVADLEAARGNLLRRGVEVSEVFHMPRRRLLWPDEPYLFGETRVNGPDPEHRSYRSFASFAIPTGMAGCSRKSRLGCLVASTPATTFASADDLASAFRRAEAAHGEHEKRIGRQTRTGLTGTPRTWWRSRPANRCRNKLSRGRCSPRTPWSRSRL